MTQEGGGREGTSRIPIASGGGISTFGFWIRWPREGSSHHQEAQGRTFGSSGQGRGHFDYRGLGRASLGFVDSEDILTEVNGPSVVVLDRVLCVEFPEGACFGGS